MLTGWLVAVTLAALSCLARQGEGACKAPSVEERFLRDDVRYASPFYVIALPRTPKTEQIDNVCYTYYENGEKFFHIISTTFKNGSNTFYTYTKGDIANRIGLAEATAVPDSSQCIYHDYTLKPICNVTVFILYRCFIDGKCGESEIDIGKTASYDVRLVLAANPHVSDECRVETEASLKDTSVLDGGDYVILPQKLKPQCVVRYNNSDSIGHQRAVGVRPLADNNLVSDRFGGVVEEQEKVQAKTPINPVKTATIPMQSSSVAQWPSYNVNRYPPLQYPPNRNSFNPYGTTVKNPGTPQSSRPVSNPSNTWNANRYGAQPMPVGQTHYHVWEQPGVTTNTVPGNSPNVFYHIHRWENSPPNCCSCS